MGVPMTIPQQMVIPHQAAIPQQMAIAQQMPIPQQAAIAQPTPVFQQMAMPVEPNPFAGAASASVRAGG